MIFTSPVVSISKPLVPASILIPPAESLAFKCKALAPVPAEVNLNSCVLPPATAISKCFPDPVIIKLESSVPSIDNTPQSIVAAA